MSNVVMVDHNSNRSCIMLTKKKKKGMDSAFVYRRLVSEFTFHTRLWQKYVANLQPFRNIQVM